MLFADAGIALAQHANVFISVLNEPATLARMREVRKYVERASKNWPNASCGLTVITAGAQALSVSKEIRDESAAITRDFPGAGNTIVVEGTGFSGSAMRAFMSGIFIVTRNRGRIHGTVDEGAAWLAPIASAASKVQLSPALLVSAAAEVRRALRPI